ncbi:hypothetical protein GCM10010124_40560 [Pilimelia terevasa]|uniref:Uncharacterized protein n=1 Tax=Pilimelia terevasa TaxID=53372 RepID=A0A8J3BR29_9ACTN|nr:hypothetical protein [Pilimelia terevasa]GGK43682.1 hypothetical protein GCM10010124_40560 [Pilimelia terevasa]
MTERTRHGRTQVDRHGIATIAGVAAATVDYWHLNRHRLGFPDHADTDEHGRHWFWHDQIQAFHAAYTAAKASGYTTVDYTGDPDEVVGSGEAARILGYRSYRSLTRRMLDNPTRIQTLPSGNLRRYWLRHTVWDYADTRVDHHSTGRPPGTTNPDRKPHRYADDPRLDAAIRLLEQSTTAADQLSARLVAQVGCGKRTARRILAVARELTDGRA